MSLPTNYKSAGGFDANNQKVLNLADATNPLDALNLRTFDAKNTVQPYNPAKTYSVDFIVEYAGQLWKCIGATGGQFDKTKWTAIRGTENWIRITGPYTASSMDSLYVDTFNAPITVTLPSNPKSGDYIRIIDAGNADKNTITIAGNGSTIDGLAGNSVLVRANSQITAIYLGGTWLTTLDLLINRVRFLTVSENLVANVMYTMLVSASFTVTLPQNPRKGDWVLLADQLGTVGSNPITVSGVDKQINGQNSFVINQKKSTWHFIYDGAGWITYNLNGDALLASNNLSDIPDKAAARNNLGLGSIATYNQGTAAGQVRLNAQNDLVYQPLATILTNLAQLVLSANKLIYATGANTFATTDLTAVARAFLAATTDTEQRAVLQLGTAATKNVGTATGNVMQVGAFGLGKTPSFAGNIDDTSIVPRGWVIVDKNNFGTTGTFPVDSSDPYAGTLHTFGDVNSVGVRQIFHTITGTPGGVTNKTYVRDQYSNNWGPWKTFAYGTGDLGTAAYRNVGTTPGNVLEVGAFGLGTSAPMVLDLNTVSGTQFFITGPTTVNDPTGFGTGDSKQGYGYQIAHSGPAWRMQQWTNVNSMRTFQRICIASTNTWGAWIELKTTQNTGTAATRNVGVAAGNVIEVGNAFGWGPSFNQPIVADIDAAFDTGCYAVRTGVTTGTLPIMGLPDGAGASLLVTAYRSLAGNADNYVDQRFIYTKIGTPTIRIFIRRFGQDSWEPWVEILTTASQYPGWTTVTYQNGWKDFDNVNYNGVQYRKEGNRVWFRGVASNPASSTSGSILFVLPGGYRPVTTKVIAVSVNPTGSSTITSNSYITVNNSGQVMFGVYGTANYPVLFDNISFEID